MGEVRTMGKERDLAWRKEIEEMSNEELRQELRKVTGNWQRDCEREMLIRILNNG